MITPAQCLEARKLLGWSRDRLAPRCGTSAFTLDRLENGEQTPPSEPLAAIQPTLEEARIEFTNGEPDVRLRKQETR